MLENVGLAASFFKQCCLGAREMSIHLYNPQSSPCLSYSWSWKPSVIRGNTDDLFRRLVKQTTPPTTKTRQDMALYSWYNLSNSGSSEKWCSTFNKSIIRRLMNTHSFIYAAWSIFKNNSFKPYRKTEQCAYSHQASHGCSFTICIIYPIRKAQ